MSHEDCCMKERNYSIDILKFACAIFIVFIHTDWRFHQEFLPVTRCAVPCFFIISGYLLFDHERGGVTQERLKRNIKHIGFITLWATLFYAFWEVMLYFNQNHAIWIPSMMRLAKLVVLNVPLFGGHLWYLFAYLYVLVIIVFVNKYNKWKQLYLLTPLLLIPHVILLLSGRELSLYLTRNFLFIGLPYFAIGTMIKAKVFKNIEKLKNYRTIFICAFILFSITSVLERHCLLSLGKCAVRDHYISTTFSAICLFFTALSFNSRKSSWLSILGEKDSLYIYIFHPVFIFCLNTLFKDTIYYNCYMYIAPIAVLLSTIVFVKALRFGKIVK